VREFIVHLVAPELVFDYFSNSMAKFAIEKARAADGSEIIPKEEYMRDVLRYKLVMYIY
jgi:hypothetical protein